MKDLNREIYGPYLQCREKHHDLDIAWPRRAPYQELQYQRPLSCEQGRYDVHLWARISNRDINE